MEFRAMKPEFQKRMKKFYPLEGEFRVKLKELAMMCFPLTGWYFLKAIKNTLNDMLDEMENLALDLLDEAAKEQMKPVLECESEI